jgi:membrane protease YdiL (CAAX protease family)
VFRYVQPAAWPPAPAGWLPPVGWRPDPYWPPVVPGTPLVRADERPGWVWRRSSLPPTQSAAVERDERPPGVEIWVVLAVFPLASVVTALVILLQHALGVPSSAAHAPALLGNRPTLNALVDLVRTLTEGVPALLVSYLLMRSGGGLRAIGLDRSQPAADLATTGKLFITAYVLPMLAAGLVVSLFVGPSSRGTTGPDHSPPQLVYLIPLIASSVLAGVVEEFVVLGYLSHRLEQRGWTGVPLVAVLVAVRLSYHLYYGWGVLELAPWAILSVILYRRRRRLLPFVVAHALWDTQSFSSEYLRGGGYALVLLGIAGLLLALFLVGRRALNQPVLVLSADGVARPPSPVGGAAQEWLGAGGASSTSNNNPSG